jgi:hypothetical protein
MVPLHAEDTSSRFLLGAAIPLLLSLLVAAQGNTRADFHAAVRPLTKAVARIPGPSIPRMFPSLPAIPAFNEGDNLRVYVERARSYLDDPRTMYYVSQALEECYAWGAEPDDDNIYAGVEIVSQVDLQEAKRSWAAEALAAPCRGLERHSIDPREILALLKEAAQRGEPHASARMLIFRDVAAPKSDVIRSLPGLLATGDPQVVRDVGAFLTRGEVSLSYGGDDFDASVAAIAWELAACDMGYPCGPMSRIVLTACALRGHCDEYLYDDAIARDEDPRRMARAQRLRGELVHALRRQDWSWLGLDG